MTSKKHTNFNIQTQLVSIIRNHSRFNFLYYLFLCLGVFCSSTAQTQESVDLLITNCRIIDGTGNPWYYGEIAIRDEQIYAIGPTLNITAKQTIDASRQVVCPGFIDVHGHLESSIFRRPEAANFVYDGVTTVVTGNCGNSLTDLTAFFQELRDTSISINIASLVGHNSVRRQVMGASDRIPTQTELDSMQSIVKQAMQDGAVGLSTGLIYVPGTYAETAEVVALAKVASAYEGIYASHMRNESHDIKEAIAEAVNIGKEANLPVEISHFKVSARKLWGLSEQTVQWIEDYRQQGLDVTVDQYPYTASSTTLAVLLPTWSLAGGTDSLDARLKVDAIKQKIIAEMKAQLAKDGETDYTYCAISRCPFDQSYNGKRISEVTEMRTGDRTLDHQIETVLELVRQGERVQMVFHKMNEEDVARIMKAPFTMIASDAGIPQFGYSVPHPRAYGTNTRVLGKYVREKGLLSLEDAIRKMTSLPASRFKFKDRGLLRSGYKADIVIFDPDTVTDQATFEQPHAYPKGINTVIVNGQITIADGVHLGTRAGSVLKNR